MTKETVMGKKSKKAQVGVGRLLLWKSSDVSQAAVQSIVLAYLTLYCTDTLGIASGLVGVLLAKVPLRIFLPDGWWITLIQSWEKAEHTNCVSLV